MGERVRGTDERFKRRLCVAVAAWVLRSGVVFWLGWAVGGYRVGLGFDHGLRFGVEARVTDSVGR